MHKFAAINKVTHSRCEIFANNYEDAKRIIEELQPIPSEWVVYRDED